MREGTYYKVWRQRKHLHLRVVARYSSLYEVCDHVQEALVLAGHLVGIDTQVGVYVGCMWAHEFVEILPRLVSPTCLAQCMQVCC